MPFRFAQAGPQRALLKLPLLCLLAALACTGVWGLAAHAVFYRRLWKFCNFQINKVSLWRGLVGSPPTLQLCLINEKAVRA